MLVALPSPGIIAGPRFQGAVPIPTVAAIDWAVMPLASRGIGHAWFGEIELAATVGGANLAVGQPFYARRTTSNTTDTFVVDSRLNDGGLGSSNVVQAQDNRMQAACELASAAVVREVRISAPDTINFNRTVTGFAVLVSYDGRLTFAPVAVRKTPQTWAQAETRSFPIDPLTWVAGLGRAAARAWRILITDGSGGVFPRIGDMAFAETIGGPSLCTLGSAVFSQIGTLANATEGDLAFDGSNTTYWAGTGTNMVGQNLGWVFDAPVDVGELRLQAPTGTAGSMPTGFDVQWSLDLLSWTTALSVTGLSGWSNNEIRTWAIP